MTKKGKLLRLFLIKIPLFLVAFSILWVLLLKWVPVRVTPLMITRAIENRKDDEFFTHQKWTRLQDISPEMVKAVIASEDNLFDTHKGFDWKEIRIAAEEYRSGKRRRGASTISQQTARNVFLFPSDSFIRKGLEAYFTVLIEWMWGKQRIMEVYLNVAEMGPGIYGAQAAAHQMFGKQASELTRREACLITACLPAPLTRNPAKPSPYVQRRASQISNLEGKLKFPDWI